MRLFLDCEFTELSRHAVLISMALYGDDENYIYAEFNDFDESRLNPWIVENVMNKLEFNDHHDYLDKRGDIVRLKGSSSFIIDELRLWLAKFKEIEIWGDVPHYDWMLFCDLFGGALGIPKNIFYIQYDVATLIKIKLEKPDLDRFELVSHLLTDDDKKNKHHALMDAKVAKLCYEKIV